MIDRVMLKQRLSMVAGYCRELKFLKELPRAEFMEKRNSAAAESFLRRSLEAIFDIGRHILARTGHLELTKEYKSIASGLAEAKVISNTLSVKLLKMAGYRNRLVHLYHIIHDEELYDIVQNNIPDLQEFVHEINLYLNGK